MDRAKEYYVVDAWIYDEYSALHGHWFDMDLFFESKDEAEKFCEIMNKKEEETFDDPRMQRRYGVRRQECAPVVINAGNTQAFNECVTNLIRTKKERI